MQSIIEQYGDYFLDIRQPNPSRWDVWFKPVGGVSTSMRRISFLGVTIQEARTLAHYYIDQLKAPHVSYMRAQFEYLAEVTVRGDRTLIEVTGTDAGEALENAKFKYPNAEEILIHATPSNIYWKREVA